MEDGRSGQEELSAGSIKSSMFHAGNSSWRIHLPGNGKAGALPAGRQALTKYLISRYNPLVRRILCEPSLLRVGTAWRRYFLLRHEVTVLRAPIGNGERGNGARSTAQLGVPHKDAGYGRRGSGISCGQDEDEPHPGASRRPGSRRNEPRRKKGAGRAKIVTNKTYHHESAQFSKKDLCQVPDRQARR